MCCARNISWPSPGHCSLNHSYIYWGIILLFPDLGLWKIFLYSDLQTPGGSLLWKQRCLSQALLFMQLWLRRQATHTSAAPPGGPQESVQPLWHMLKGVNNQGQPMDHWGRAHGWTLPCPISCMDNPEVCSTWLLSGPEWDHGHEGEKITFQL